MDDPTKKSKKEKVKAKQSIDARASARGLESAYSDDEPEYTLDMLTALSPDYEGTDKKCESDILNLSRNLI